MAEYSLLNPLSLFHLELICLNMHDRKGGAKGKGTN